MTANSHLWTILGIEQTNIYDIERLDLLLNTFQDQDRYNEITLQNDVDILMSILKELFVTHYDKIIKIDIENRRCFFNAVRDKLRPMQNKFFNNSKIPRRKQEELVEQTKLLRILCLHDFSTTPLAFTTDALKYLNTIKELQNGLLNLIEQIRLKNPTQLGTFLDDAYQAIKQNHQNIVITLLGCSKASKSSLINFILGDQICPTDNTEATARLTKIIYGQQIRLSLISSSGKKQDFGEFNNTRELLQKATELIKLKGIDRTNELCKDEVIIELPINELKNVQLWDIPGFDENPLIDNRINEILNDTDLIFAVIPHKDGLKQSFIDFIKPRLKQSHNLYDKDFDKNINNQKNTTICFLISQIDDFKPDQQTNQTQDDFLQHIYDKLQNQLDIKLGDTNVNNDDNQHTYKLSCNFIPMCSDPRYSLMHYLQCRQQFIKKSCIWFETGLQNIMYDRLDYLLKTIQEVFNYNDISRIYDRCLYIEKIFKNRYEVFTDVLRNTLEMKVNEVQSIVLNSIDELVQQCIKFKESHEAKYIEDYIKNQIKTKFNDAMEEKQLEIKREITKMLKDFSNAFNFGPQDAQILDQVLSDALSENPYKVKIGQYQYKNKNIGYAYVKRIARAMFDSILGWSPFKNAEHYRYSSHTFVSPQEYTRYQTKKSITNLLNEIIAAMKNELHDKTIQTLEQLLTEYCNRIIESIQAKKQKFMHAQTTDINTVVIIRNFLKEKSLQITCLYLNILDKQFDIKYSTTLNVNQNDKIGESLYPVFAGTLEENEQPIAAKLIPVKKLNIQEVRYIYELKYTNVMRYYGVKKYDDKHYYIIMPRLDCDLNQYMNKNGTRLNSNRIDQMILQIIRGLNYIHTKLELIHRDIKPENIFVKENGENEPLFLLADFGFIHQEPLTIVGTPGYIAPELLSRNNPGLITTKCDIYSLGITIKNIIELSNIEQLHNQLIIMWSRAAENCCLEIADRRPSCQELLEYRSSHN